MQSESPLQPNVASTQQAMFRLLATCTVAILALQFYQACRIDLYGDDLPILASVRLASEGILNDFRVQDNGFWRPATRLLYRFANALWGTAGWYAALSVIVHAINVLLVYRLATARRGLGLSQVWGAAAALLFAANFAWSEAVPSLSASGDKLLATAMMFGMLWGGTAVRYGVATLLCVCAKDNGLVFPLVAFAWEMCVRRESLRSAFRKVVPAAILAAACLGWTVVRISHASIRELAPGDQLSPGTNAIRLLIDQWAALFLYGPFDTNVRGLFNLSPLLMLRWAVRGMALGVTALFFLRDRGNSARPRWVALPFLIWAACLLVTNSIRSGGITSRYLYELGPAWALFVIVGSRGALERTRNVRSVAIAFLGVLAAWCTMQCADWSASPAIRYTTTVPRVVRKQMEALLPAYVLAAIPPASTIVLSGSALHEVQPRHELLMKAYVALLYPSMLFDVRMLEQFPLGSKPGFDNARVFDFTWNSQSEEWNVTERRTAQTPRQ